jgi:hypothetical protein
MVTVGGSSPGDAAMKTALGMITAAAIAGFATVAVAEDVTSMTDPKYPYYPPIGKFFDYPKPYSKYYYHPAPPPDACVFDKKPFFKDAPGKDVKFREKKIKFYDYDYHRYDYLTRIVAKCKIPLDLYYYFKKRFVLKGFHCTYTDYNYYNEVERELVTYDSKLVIKKGAKHADLKCVFLDKPDYEEPEPNGETPTETPTTEAPPVEEVPAEG